MGGQRPRDNNFTVEGVDNNNKRVTGALITVPPEAVENFTLLSNQFNAEFGHSSGGQFNTTVKSGTNSFHGSAYEYFRNRNLNAVDQTWVQQGLTTNPRFDSNRFGGTLGGPIIKNKLFFFTNFERNPVGFISVGGGAVQAPTAAGLAAMNADPNLNATNFGIFQTYVPAGYDPVWLHYLQRNDEQRSDKDRDHLLTVRPRTAPAAPALWKSATFRSFLLRGRAGQILSRAWITTCRTKTRFADALSTTRRTCWTMRRSWGLSSRRIQSHSH